MERTIIKIDEAKCNGCGKCIPDCPEGALQIIDGKARLVSDLFCDGLGACIGHCPEGAISVEEREAEPYDEKEVMENIAKQGKNVIQAHLKHLMDHDQKEYFKQAMQFLKERNIKIPIESVGRGQAKYAHDPSSCPGTKAMQFEPQKSGAVNLKDGYKSSSQLRNWPVQIMLIPVRAPYFKNADLLIAADCVPFSYGDFHAGSLEGKVLLVGCPKLDDIELYKNKLTQIMKGNDIKSVTCAHMEVPCCFGMVDIVKSAISESGKQIYFKEATIGIKGDRIS